jgi:hypothetical protein
MSIQSNFTKLRQSAGVDGVVLFNCETGQWLGDVAPSISWLENSMRVAVEHMPDDLTSYRVRFKDPDADVPKDHGVFVYRDGDETVAVAHPNGHQVGKSLARMLRNFAGNKPSRNRQKVKPVEAGWAEPGKVRALASVDSPEP